jgi:hypothetical protein
MTDPHRSDPLYTYLTAMGADHDTAALVVERAAIIQHQAGKSRWKASIEAQMQTLGEVKTNRSDI